MPHTKDKGGRKRVMSGSPEQSTNSRHKQKKHNSQSESIAEDPESISDEDGETDEDQSTDIEEVVSRIPKDVQVQKGKKRAKESLGAQPLIQQTIRELTQMLVTLITETVSAAVQKEMKSLRKEIKEEKSSTALYAQQ